jgi:prepilin-type N-terminal cleavage/methylation domain-containing protein
MTIFPKNNRGFTIVEMLVVCVIMAISLGAIFSLYVTHVKSFYTQDTTLEMEQNLRTAMETTTRSLKNAGMMIPLNATPGVTPFGVQSTYSSSVTINSASSDGVYACITQSKGVGAAYSVYSTTVDGVSNFSAGDRLRLINPLMGSPVLANYTTLFVYSGKTPSGTTMYMVPNPPSSTFAAGTAVSAGNMYAKAAYPTSAGQYDSVQFYLSSGGSCPASQTCLVRNTNNGTVDVIASYMSSLRFSYLYTDGTEDNLGVTGPKVRAVRVTMSGTAATANGTKTKQLTSLVMMRNIR